MTVESGARPSNTLSGELRSRPLVVLLAGVCERRTSGTFTFRLGARIDQITMHVGKIVTGIELAEETFCKVRDLFSLPEETTWTFRQYVQHVHDLADEEPPAIDTWPAIWRGLCDQPPAPHMRRTLAKIDGVMQLRDSSGLDRFGFGPTEMELCRRLHVQASTVDHFVTTSSLVADRTLALVYVLALARCIVRVEAQPVGPIELGVAGVRDRVRAIELEEPYKALGLRAEASPEAARAAYFRLARMWHADKIPPALLEVRAECARVLVRLGEAYRTITDKTPWRRAESVVASIGVGGGVANDSVIPAKAATTESVLPGVHEPSIVPPATMRATMRDVDDALARGDLHTAQTIASSLRSTGVSGPAARAVIAWCVLGGNTDAEPATLEHALAALDRILTGDPDCVRALDYRARVLKRLGRIDASVRDSRKLLRLDPHHIDAREEVRLYDMSAGRTWVR